MRAVVWDTSAIFLGRTTSLIFNFESLIWEERRQFMAGVDNFALSLVNATIFIAGGVDGSKTKDDDWMMSCTDKIRSVPVMDIIKNKSAHWKNHALLSKPTMIHCYCSVSLPLGQPPREQLS